MAVQKRGQARRDHILKVTRHLLKEQDLSSVSLADIATTAGVPVSSIYHFYPNVIDIYRSLIEQFRYELVNHLERQFEGAFTNGEVKSWQQLVDGLIDGSAEFYRDHFEFQQLILSGKAPAQVKQLDRDNDSKLARVIVATFSEYFQLPAVPNLENIVFNSVEMVDLFFSLSVYHNQLITDEGVAETKRAVLSYLRCYLPEFLLPRDLSF